MFKEIDKQLHFLAGGVVSLLTTIAILSTPIAPYAPIVGILASLIVGILKEIYDLYIKKTVFDKRDVIATVVGGTISLVAFIFI